MRSAPGFSELVFYARSQYFRRMYSGFLSSSSGEVARFQGVAVKPARTSPRAERRAILPDDLGGT
jgi:hypothetical protein